MILQQVFVLFCLVISMSASTIKPASELNRQKRTIQYFLDGLFSAFNERRPMNARTISDHRTSTLTSLAKLSSLSTPPKNDDVDDDDESNNGNLLNLSHEKPALFIPLPIPSIASTLLKSTTENRVPQSTTSKRVEFDVQMFNHSSNNISQVEKTVTKTTTIAPAKIPTMKIVSNQTITLNRTQTTTMIPNQTQATTTTTSTTTTTTTTTEEPRQTVSVVFEPTTIKPDSSTDLPELTTLYPLDSEMIEPKNPSPSDNEIQTKMEKRNAPMKASNLHTTQFFDGPLVVENDRKHKPIYLDDCIEVNCNNDINVIQSRILPNFRNAPIISMTIALPVSTSNIDLNRQNKNNRLPIQNYNVLTLHTIPIYNVDAKRLSNEIIDPPTTRHSNK